MTIQTKIVINARNIWEYLAFKFLTTSQRSHQHLSRLIASVVVDRKETDEYYEKIGLDFKEPDDINIKKEAPQEYAVDITDISDN